MLIEFTVNNWMSYNQETKFTMIGTSERQHQERVAKVSKFGKSFKILPFCTIFGGNASGKSNFFEGLNFVKKIVTQPLALESTINTKPFKLNSKSSLAPSNFVISMLIGEFIYEYSFSLNVNQVFSEKLVKINSNSDYELFNRCFVAESKTYKYSYCEQLNQNKNKDLKNKLRVISEGTPKNRLFLTNTVHQQLDVFLDVYNWFNNKLEIVAPTAQFQLFEHFFNENSDLHIRVNEMLSMLDTGVIKLGFDRSSINNITNEKIKNWIRSSLSKYKSIKFTDAENQRCIASMSDTGEVVVDKMVTYHKDDQGEELKFDIHDESEGTRRLIDLLPIMLNAIQELSNKVYVVDEIERSLNTLLTKKLMEIYFQKCNPSSRTQLIVSTHDLFLMDQDMIRRDEMWISERKKNGCSFLYPLSNFKDVRYDKDIRKSYLQGKLGGVPKTPSF